MSNRELKEIIFTVNNHFIKMLDARVEEELNFHKRIIRINLNELKDKGYEFERSNAYDTYFNSFENYANFKIIALMNQIKPLLLQHRLYDLVALFRNMERLVFTLWDKKELDEVKRIFEIIKEHSNGITLTEVHEAIAKMEKLLPVLIILDKFIKEFYRKNEFCVVKEEGKLTLNYSVGVV